MDFKFYLRYRDSVDNTDEENSSLFSLIRMQRLSSAMACGQHRDGHGLGQSMGWVGLNEKYCCIVAEHCKTYTFHCH